MPTKTDRILSYLPGTFRALPRPTALYSVVDAFGGELLKAENSLAAIMAAHWVDHADRAADLIDDLGRIAALYGLAPRLDESVEEFRDHLKRYIRIFLDGPSTVQGILRVTAEALGLRINDDYLAMDPWWMRSGDGAIVSIAKRGDDASMLLFGFDARSASGEAAQAATIVGTKDLSGAIDLRGASILSLGMDGGALANIDLATQVDPAAAVLEDIKRAINMAIGQPVASQIDSNLTLTSPTTGSGSLLKIADVSGDASPRLLGLLPRSYYGAEATAAKVTGIVDLPDQVDLSDVRYLRLLVDGKHLAEIDCAANNPAATTIADIEKAINNGIGMSVATHTGARLTLTSPTTGFGSSVAFQAAAAQDARERLFGAAATFVVGSDARSASAVSINDWSGGVDLSARSKVRIRLDGSPAVTVDCAGADPARTLLSEIVALLNADLGPAVASHDGRFLRIASPTSGLASTVSFETPPENEDATELLFGIKPRVFQGADDTKARIIGARDISAGLDLAALHVIQVGLDAGPSKEVDVASSATNLRGVTLQEIGTAINHALDSVVASDDGQHLILTSPTLGNESRLTIEPLLAKRRRSFVTRAFMTDEAALTVFGFLSKEAQGTTAVPARVEGTVDLSRSVDLRDARWLRLAVDGQPAVEIDCAGTRPRATLIKEVRDKLNGSKLGSVASVSDDEKTLLLTSPTVGASSRIMFEAPHGALDLLLGHGPASFSGRDATRVTFVGTVDLSAGIDLSTASKMKISIDGEEHEIDCANATDPVHTGLIDIIVAISLAFTGKAVVSSADAHIVLQSQTIGENSRIEFAPPSERDATKLIFGCEAPRTYHGINAFPAQFIGKGLTAPVDVSAARFLRIAVNGGVPLDIDCSAEAADASSRSLADIVATINAAFDRTGTPALATEDNARLAITTKTTGALARLDLLPHASSDARAKLFGDAEETPGADPSAAVITGTADLLAPVDLSERSIIRLSVDSAAPVEVEIAGAAPSTTSLDEIVAQINTVFPNIASPTDDDRLCLTSRTRGQNSRLELQPLRVLELIDYPPTSAADPPADNPLRSVQPGDKWSVINDGAADASIEVELYVPHGVVGPQLVNHVIGQRVRIMEVVHPGERLKVWFDDEVGLRASIYGTDGSVRPVADSNIRVFSIGPQVTADSNPISAKLAAVLTLPRGQSDWSYMECHSSRFNCDTFDAAWFAGKKCTERGVFDVSRFAQESPELEIAVFSSSPPFSDPPVEIRFRWLSHQPGAFVVNLPADLPERFGGRFNLARFAHAGEKPDEGEQFHGVVTEPDSDPDYLKTRINTGPNPSKLVRAEVVARVPIGFEAATMPFRKPRSLTLGTETEPAKIYLAEKDVSGFIELSARSAGSWGNSIQVVARKAGPAFFDVTIKFLGARFENARLVAMGGEDLPASVEEMLKPSPMGILQAKAAGVRAAVTRDGAEAIT